MCNFMITTDSNADLPSDFLQKHHITTIPQYYAFGDTVYGDEIHLTPAEFYQRMREGVLPTSMANNPDVIRRKFEAVLKEGFDILHIAFSSALSGSYNNVAMVSKELAEVYPDARIKVIDSLNASLGEALLVLYAYELKEAGKSMDEIAQAIEEEKSHIHLEFTVNDLHHLQRGGRVSKATAIIGSMINIKPTLSVDSEGKLVPLSTVRGRKKSLSSLVNNMASLSKDFDKSRPVGIMHGDCIEDARYVAKLIEERMGCTNILINDVSPSIGTHAGPGIVGIAYRF